MTYPERAPTTIAGCDRRPPGDSRRTSDARSSRGSTTLLAALRACAAIRRGSLGLARRWSSALVLVVLLLCVPATAAADDEAWRAWHPRVDVEPAAWFLRGYSIHVGAQPPSAPRLLLAAGAYAFDVPGLLVDLASGNRDEMWDVRLYLGYGGFVEYFFGDWRVGGQIGMQHTEATLGADSTRFASLLVLARAGYEWHPWGYGGYIFPWAGAAFLTEVAGDTGGYDTLPVVPYLTVDVGWRL